MSCTLSTSLNKGKRYYLDHMLLLGIYDSHVLVGCLEGIRGILHRGQDGSVCVGALQGLPLHLNGGQGAIDLLQLLLQALLLFEGLQGH